MGDRSRLPKWAQHELITLESNVEYWKGIAADGPADSDTFVQNYENPKPLGKGTRISFMLPDDVELQAMITQFGQLEIMSRGGSNGSLHVIPSSSNVVKIVVGEW